MDQEKYKKLCHEIDTELAEIVQEFTDSRNILRNDRRFVKTRLLLAFSFLEVICNLYNAFYDLKLTNAPLLKKWFKEFCLLDQNITYKKHPYIKMISENHLYNFRNSIIHAFSLPEPENGISIICPNGSEISDIIEKMDIGFRAHGHQVAFVSADSLMQLFISGFTLMHPKIFKDVSRATESDFEGLERIVKEFNRRGAKAIPLNGNPL